MSGGEIAFRLNIDLARPVSDMIAGIHIHHEAGWQAFGTNSAMLEKPLRNLGAGRHLLEFKLAARLPEGRYRVGFAFLEPAADGMRTLAWLDRVLSFETRIVRDVPSIGACNVTASFEHISAARNEASAEALPAARLGLLGRLRNSAHAMRAGS
jgi:hypothetical protein